MKAYLLNCLNVHIQFNIQFICWDSRVPRNLKRRALIPTMAQRSGQVARDKLLTMMVFLLDSKLI